MDGKVNCREASKLLSLAQERPLESGETVALRLHLALCGMCRNFEKQLAFLREAAQRFRSGE